LNDWYADVETIYPYFEQEGTLGLVCLYLYVKDRGYALEIGKMIGVVDQAVYDIIRKNRTLFDVDKFKDSRPKCTRTIYYRLSEEGIKYIKKVLLCAEDDIKLEEVRKSSPNHVNDKELEFAMECFENEFRFERLCLYLYNHKGYPYQIERELGWPSKTIDLIIRRDKHKHLFSDYGRFNNHRYLTLSNEGRMYVERIVQGLKSGEIEPMEVDCETSHNSSISNGNISR